MFSRLQQGTNKATKLVDIKNIESIDKTKASGKNGFNKPALKLLTKSKLKLFKQSF